MITQKFVIFHQGQWKLQLRRVNSAPIMNSNDSEIQDPLSEDGTNNLDRVASQIYEFLGFFVQVSLTLSRKLYFDFNWLFQFDCE